MTQLLVHYGIHFIIPLIVALLFYKQKWKITYLIFLATMVVDIDHLLANPIFDANRCSINFHPLHSYYAIAIYIALLIPKKTRVVAIGLCIHMIADYCDCLLM